MFDALRIAPSILSADFMNMERDIRRIEQAGASLIHVDVMDGHFVPNLTMGVPVVAQLKRLALLPLDVHLMIDNPLEQLPWFLDAGADGVTVHLEALQNPDEVHRALALIHEAGAAAALAIKPDTPVSRLAPYLSELDMVLIMSVYPGFSGQSYIEGSEARVAEVVQLARAAQVSPLIELDGGMSPTTVGRVCAAGADVIVAGNAVFAAPDPGVAIAELKAAAEVGRKVDAEAGLTARDALDRTDPATRNNGEAD